MTECFALGVVVAESVGVAVEVENHGAVQEPVEHGGGDGGVAEDLAPRCDAAVGGQDDAGLQVALGHDLEQCGGGFAGQREVAELVDDQQGGAGEESHGGGPPAFDRRAARSAAVVK